MFNRKVVDALKNRLRSSEETIAVAESVTNGFLQAALASAEGASTYFQGGMTVYNVGQKYRHLLIDPIHALSCNCVSERVAKEMALHVCEKFSSDWGLGITGYATPTPESGQELYAYFGIVYQGRVLQSGILRATGTDPEAVKLWYVNQLLGECLHALSSLIESKTAEVVVQK